MIATGQTVGQKPIHMIEPVTVDGLRFGCLDSLVGPIEIRSFAVYKANAEQMATAAGVVLELP